MEEESQDQVSSMKPVAQDNQGDTSRPNIVIIGLVVALIAALAVIGFLLIVYVLGDGSGADGGAALPLPGAPVETTVLPPTPEPGDPTAIVTAPAGVNVRTGPGNEFTIIGIAPFNSVLEVVGISTDRTWWVINIPSVPQNYGWVSAEFVQVQDGDNVLVIPSPPTPTPVVLPTPTATPAPEITFTASRTTINAGEQATLSWSVENVRAVYLYPIGDPFESYPVIGQGSREVQPFITTSYELLTFNQNGSTSAARIEITVVSGLTSGRWILQSYSTPDGGLLRPLPGSEVTARFGADGSLVGSAGCNSYTGTFTAYDQKLRVNMLTASQSLCDMPEGIMAQEGAFLGLLQQAATMTINAGQMTIFDSDGDRVMEFISG